MTENSSAFRRRAFRKACEEAKLKHERTRPSMPWTNGKVERFIQSSLRERAYLQSFASSAESGAAIRPGLHDYKSTRPHTALAGKPPLSKLNLDNLLGNNSQSSGNRAGRGTRAGYKLRGPRPACRRVRYCADAVRFVGRSQLGSSAACNTGPASYAAKSNRLRSTSALRTLRRLLDIAPTFDRTSHGRPLRCRSCDGRLGPVRDPGSCLLLRILQHVPATHTVSI